MNGGKKARLFALFTVLRLGTLDVFYYAPVLFALALVTGAATGFLAQEVLRRMGKHGYVQPLDFIVFRPFLDFKNKKNSQKL